MDYTRRFDIEDLYELRKKAPTQKKRDEVDLQIYKILNQHPKISALRFQLLNAFRNNDSKMVGKISQHIRFLQVQIDNGYNI